MISKEQWKELCRTYDKWCYYHDVINMSLEEAKNHIINTPDYVTTDKLLEQLLL